jgi:ring-1,2-phenylacetyl-CoA epoxidase subunit PaaC
MDQLPEQLKQPFVQLLLSIADDKFMLGHRNADWTGLAPILEEDIAFSSMSQDELAHASVLYQIVANLSGTKADKLAFGRRADEYRCAAIVELSDEFNWATALCRNFFCDHFDLLRLDALTQSSYTPIAQVAGRLAAEEKIHVEHADSWIVRLGGSGDQAHDRIQGSLDDLAPRACSLFEPTEGADLLVAQGVYPATSQILFDRWSKELQQVVRDAGLRLTVPPLANVVGGRRGRHSEAFLPLLDELTEVYRIEPEAAW